MATKAQVTVEEYLQQFFLKYLGFGYGKTMQDNAETGAEALLAMLKLVWQKGGREDMHSAFFCFKEQLMAARQTLPALQQQRVDALFALLESLVAAAERLRQFSPVKESLTGAVLQEARGRLYRVLVGDAFAGDLYIRRRALHCCYRNLVHEQAQRARRAQQQQQVSKGLPASPTAPAAPARPWLRSPLIQAATGPDLSSWESLWDALAAMPGARMLPLMQSTLADAFAAQAQLQAQLASGHHHHHRRNNSTTTSSSSKAAGGSTSAAAPPAATVDAAAGATGSTAVRAASSSSSASWTSTPSCSANPSRAAIAVAAASPPPQQAQAQQPQQSASDDQQQAATSAPQHAGKGPCLHSSHPQSAEAAGRTEGGAAAATPPPAAAARDQQAPCCAQQPAADAAAAPPPAAAAAPPPAAAPAAAPGDDAGRSTRGAAAEAQQDVDAVFDDAPPAWATDLPTAAAAAAAEPSGDSSRSSGPAAGKPAPAKMPQVRAVDVDAGAAPEPRAASPLLHAISGRLPSWVADFSSSSSAAL